MSIYLITKTGNKRNYLLKTYKKKKQNQSKILKKKDSSADATKTTGADTIKINCFFFSSTILNPSFFHRQSEFLIIISHLKKYSGYIFIPLINTK